MSIKTQIVKFGAKALITGKKWAPVVSFVAGVAMSAWATVEAVKATLHAEEEILEPAKKEFEAADTLKETNEAEYKKARRDVYARSTGRALRLYGKALGIWCASMTLVVVGFGTQTIRLREAVNFGVGAATALSNMHDNTKQVFGSEVADALRTGEGIPEAVEKLDIDKVKNTATKHIKYASDVYRDYSDKDVEISDKTETPAAYKVTKCDPLMFVIFDFNQEDVNPEYWYKTAINRLENLKAIESRFNQLLETEKVDFVTVAEAKQRIGYRHIYREDYELGWWKTKNTTHYVDFGLGRLWELKETLERKHTPAYDVQYQLTHVMVDDGLDVKRDWTLVFDVMGNVFDHRFGPKE